MPLLTRACFRQDSRGTTKPLLKPAELEKWSTPFPQPVCGHQLC